MLKSSLCNYSDAYILVKGTITVAGLGAATEVRQASRKYKQAIFKACEPFTYLNCCNNWKKVLKE